MSSEHAGPDQAEVLKVSELRQNRYPGLEVAADLLNRPNEYYFGPLAWVGVKAGEKAAGRYRKHFWRNNALTGAALSGALAAVATFGVSTETEGHADMNKAQTSVEVKDIAWDKTQAITPATVYFAGVLDAQDIPYDIVVNKCVTTPFGKGCSPDLYVGALDPKVNKELEGAAQDITSIPFDAITAWTTEDDNKIDIRVDMSKTKAALSWVGDGPDIRDYTLDGNKKNYGDRAGFRKTMADFSGALQKVINLDTLANTIEDLDNDVEDDMSLKALEAFGTCNKEPEFKLQFKSLAEEAIRANFDMLSDGRKINKITFTNTGSDFEVDTGQRAAKVLGDTYDQSSYKLDSGNFKLDKLECNIDKQRVAN